MLMLQQLVTKESAAELVARVARRAYQRNGVVTDLRSFGKGTSDTTSKSSTASTSMCVRPGFESSLVQLFPLCRAS